MALVSTASVTADGCAMPGSIPKSPKRLPMRRGTNIMLDVATKSELREALDTQTLRLTVRLRLMLAAGVSILAAIQRIH
jgi:hypothetical protein